MSVPPAREQRLHADRQGNALTCAFRKRYGGRPQNQRCGWTLQETFTTGTGQHMAVLHKKLVHSTNTRGCLMASLVSAAQQSAPAQQYSRIEHAAGVERPLDRSHRR